MTPTQGCSSLLQQSRAFAKAGPQPGIGTAPTRCAVTAEPLGHWRNHAQTPRPLATPPGHPQPLAARPDGPGQRLAEHLAARLVGTAQGGLAQGRRAGAAAALRGVGAAHPDVSRFGGGCAIPGCPDAGRAEQLHPDPGAQPEPGHAAGHRRRWHSGQCQFQRPGQCRAAGPGQRLPVHAERHRRQHQRLAACQRWRRPRQPHRSAGRRGAEGGQPGNRRPERRRGVQRRGRHAVVGPSARRRSAVAGQRRDHRQDRRGTRQPPARAWRQRGAVCAELDGVGHRQRDAGCRGPAGCPGGGRPARRPDGFGQRHHRRCARCRAGGRRHRRAVAGAGHRQHRVGGLDTGRLAGQLQQFAEPAGHPAGRGRLGQCGGLDAAAGRRLGPRPEPAGGRQPGQRRRAGWQRQRRRPLCRRHTDQGAGGR